MSVKPNTAEDISPDTVTGQQKALDRLLRRKWGDTMGLLHWKSIKFIALIVGIWATIELVNEGADPLFGLILIGVLLAGPELLEYLAVASDFHDYRDEMSDEKTRDEKE